MEWLSYVQKLVHECGIHGYHNNYEHPATINSFLSYTETHTHAQCQRQRKKDQPCGIIYK